MRLPTRPRPRYADVAATLALMVALGGTSYAVTALPRNSVGAKQLKPDSVTSSKVLNGSLLAKDFAKGQLPRGAAGATGAPGIQGQSGPQGLPGPVAVFTGHTPSGSFPPSVGSGGMHLATVQLAAGSYLLYGNVIFNSTHASPQTMTCGLGAPGYDPDGNARSQIDKEVIFLGPSGTGSISAAGAIQLALPTTATLTCYEAGVIDAGGVDFEDANIVAVRVNEIN
jgi:hypothetical protein